MTVLKVTVVIPGTNREQLVGAYGQLLATKPVAEFRLPGHDLLVTAYPGLSVLTGPPEALAPVRELRATILVDSLSGTEAQLLSNGWKEAGSLNPSTSRLLRDPGGNLIELVVEPDRGTTVAPE